MTDPVSQKIIQIISENLGVEEKEITSQSDFFEDLNADKLELIDLVLKVQQVFNFVIPEGRLNKIQKVSDLISEVELNSEFLNE